MNSLLLVLLLGCTYSVYADDTCDGPQDPKVYLFGYGFSFGPYEYLNDDGELMGLGYDITRSVCKVMNKKCEHAVYYDYNYAYNEQGVSIALNDNWYDALVNWVPTPQRLSSYQFCRTYAHEPASYLFVRDRDSDVDTMDELKRNAAAIGFRSGFRTSPDCLENYLGISLGGKSKYYNGPSELEQALQTGEVDAIFTDEIDILNHGNVQRIGDEPVKCAAGDMTIMYRKDRDLSWFGEGVEKLRANGDYGWLCNMNSNDVDPGCL